MTELELRQTVVNVMLDWYKKGVKESDGSHRQIIDLYNKYGDQTGYHMTYSDPWCATAASAAFLVAEHNTGIPFSTIIPKECSCERMIQKFAKLGEWEENDAYVPTIGDYIFYDWNDTGVGDDTGISDHVGIITGINMGRISTVEGNYNNGFGKRSIAINGRYIRGFGLPNYAKLASSSTTTKTTTTSNITSNTATTTKTYTAGTQYYLKNVPFYISSTASTPATTHTGKYYIWSGSTVRNRIRVTTNKKYIGVTGKVTGWVNISDLGDPVSNLPKLETGAQVTLNSVDIYKSAYMAKASSSISGNYFIWSTSMIKNRIRITIKKDYVGKVGKVTGWINYSDIADKFAPLK